MPKSKTKKSTKYIPYAKGFYPTEKKSQLAAIGSSPMQKEFDPGQDGAFFVAIPPCTSIDDWLAQYNEEGQSYSDFLKDCPWLSRRKCKYMKQEFHPHGATLPQKYPTGTIYLLPLGQFTGVTSPQFSALVEYTEIFFHLPVKCLPPLELEINSGEIFCIIPNSNESGNSSSIHRSTRTRKLRLKSRYDRKTGHRQLCVDSALLWLRQEVPQNAICTIVLTMTDLYEDDPDLFVAGMAAGNHRVAIFSFYRYDPALSFSTEFWYEVQEDKSLSLTERQKLVLLRSCRLLVHEISHLLGVDHCIFYSCCMNGSGHLAEDFRQPMYLCPIDLHKLQTLCGFDVKERYQRLLGFFRKHQMSAEQQWVEKRITFLNNVD